MEWNLALLPVLDRLVDVLPEILFSFLGLFIGWMWGNWQAISAWKKKEFHTTLVVSLNSLFPATKPGIPVGLRLRTLFEKDLKEVFPNSAMVDIVKKSIGKTTEKDPILRFEKDDSWYLLNAVLNKIAEMYCEGSVKKDMGIPTQAKWYIFCLTFERAGGMRVQKPRVMIMEKQNFLNFPESGDVELEDPERHSIRVNTIRTLKKEYEKNPHLFLEMEIIF